MPVVAGIAGSTRNAAAALCVGGQAVAVCEQERVTRTRGVPLSPGCLPAEALAAVLRTAGLSHANLDQYAVGEDAVRLETPLPVTRLDHHLAHASTAYYTSGFEEATVLVCDTAGREQVSLWEARAGRLSPLPFSWQGPGFAAVYTQCTAALGYQPGVDEYRVEAMAQVAGPDANTSNWVTYRDGHLDISDRLLPWLESLGAHETNAVERRARAAATVQQSLGEALASLIVDVRTRSDSRHLCLAGGLFFNSSFNTRVAGTGLFERVFVPVNPGNAGLAVGSALSASAREPMTGPVTPFLGPAFGPEEIKATLDNCKLSYDLGHDGEIVDEAVEALVRGRLVAWFRGRMEWGPRALGNRSILASPRAEYTLANLNVYLKQREPYRPYSVAICEEDVYRFFAGPPRSRFMEFEYEVLDAELFRAVLPLRATRLRVQTVPASAGSFHQLLRAFGDRTGVPALVHTSFNGFNEPIVCSPRDAVRVFYGTGLDLAVLGNFVLRK